MKQGAIAIVVLGLGTAVALGLGRGFDTMSVVILVILTAVGALGIAIAARAESGLVAPRRCDECGGVISPNAPYCKHCGARLQQEGSVR